MAFQITVQGGIDDGKTFRVDGQCIIGRAPRCQVLLSEPDIAWEHASLQDLSGRLFLQNLSASGTRINGKAISADTRLVSGDEFEITPNCTLVVEERIGKQSRLTLTPPIIGGIFVLIAVLMFGAYKALQTPPRSIPPKTLAHWNTAVERLTARMVEWEQRGEFPEEGIKIFSDAWRFEMAYNDKVAAERWDILHSVLLTLKLPGSGSNRRSIAESASPNARALDVIMGWDQYTSMSVDPQWRTDEAFADALTWFVRKRGISTNEKASEAGQ
ncbi:MAG: hypothetical protein ACI8TQ_000908 [Planctomycetota bacterium]|jgi:hypothetical protein